MIKKISYDRRVYESVDDNSLSKAISQKTDEKNKSCNKGLMAIISFVLPLILYVNKTGVNAHHMGPFLPSAVFLGPPRESRPYIHFFPRRRAVSISSSLSGPPKESRPYIHFFSEDWPLTPSTLTQLLLLPSLLV